MEIFKFGHFTYVAVPVSEASNAAQALKIANKHFKKAYSRLMIRQGSTHKDTLYFEEKKGYKKVWIVCTKGRMI